MPQAIHCRWKAARFSRLVQCDEFFAGDIWITQASTDKEFDTALKLAEHQDKMCYIEIFTEKMDLPFITAKTIERLKNKQKVEKASSFS